MSDPISTALEEAASRQPFIPDLGDAVRRGRRRQARRRRGAFVAAVVGAGLLVTGITVGLPEQHDQIATVQPAPAAATPTTPTAPTASTAPLRTAADPALVTQVTTLAPTVFAAAGVPANSSGIHSISGPALVFDGKPGVFWNGAEYCPYCAAQRWSLVVALSRFGTWSGLSTTTSSSSDVYPNTATFTFYGSTYRSPYVSFQSVETQTNRSPSESLETLTPEQTALMKLYDDKASIPFVDFGNSFEVTGASYDATVLAGKSASEIASALSDPTTAISKAVLGTANSMTVALCAITDHQPAAVCDSPPIAH
jgi:hypothetical protein